MFPFYLLGPKSTLAIRQGQHSVAPLLDSVNTYQHHKLPRGQEFVVPATSGFYIRLVGYFTNKSHLAIIYTTFRYEGEYPKISGNLTIIFTECLLIITWMFSLHNFYCPWWVYLKFWKNKLPTILDLVRNTTIFYSRSAITSLSVGTYITWIKKKSFIFSTM